MTKTQLHRLSNYQKKEHNWFNLKSWTPEQAVCLFYEINPFEYEQIKNHEGIQWILLTAKENQSQSPQEWKEFAIKNQIPIPTAFNRIPIVESVSNEVNQKTTSNNDEKNELENQSPQELKELVTKNQKPASITINSIFIIGSASNESNSIENDTNPPSQTPPLNTSQPEKPLTKLEKQHQAILDVIKLKQFDPMQIPDGEKGTIEAICKNDEPLLFDSESSFHTAWKKGRHLFKMANHESYARRGRK